VDSKNQLVDEIVDTDVLVIGGAAAGVTAAIEAAKYGLNVVLADKGRVGFSGSTPTSDGETAAINHPEDSEEVYLKETIEGGGFVNVRELAEVLIKEGNQAVEKLEIYGVPYIRNPDGKIKVDRESSMSYPRTPNVKGGGPAFSLALRKEALHRGVKFYENMMAHELVLAESSVNGCLSINVTNGKNIYFHSKAVILAAGSATDLYPHATADYKTTGDGYWLGWNAGLEFINMEFLEFRIMVAPYGVPLPSAGIGHIRKAGAKFYNALGDQILRKTDPDRKKLVQRVESAYGLYKEIKEGRGPIYMDATAVSEEDYYYLEHVIETGILKKLRDLGVDYRKERFQWFSPGLHTFLGGVRIDGNCLTSVPGLYAAGENAGGVYGADRNGNYLTACAVFGFRSGTHAAKTAMNTDRKEIPWQKIQEKLQELNKIKDKREGNPPNEVRNELKETAGNYLAFDRDKDGLKVAIRKFDDIMEEGIYRARVKNLSDFVKILEIRNLCLTGRLIAEAALRRTETRGQHLRVDYPKMDSSWQIWILLRKEGGKIRITEERIPQEA